MLKLGVPWILAALLTACTPTHSFDGTGGDASPGPPNPDGSTATSSCSGSATRCIGNTYQTCKNGMFATGSVCSSSDICDPALGCVQCNPADPKTCVGNLLYSCNANGSLGGIAQDCDPGQCVNNACTTTCSNGAINLIYVVDVNNQLLSFNPQTNQFTKIGTLKCKAKASWPDWSGGNPATPFSMAVDRQATAWVLYTSGQIFQVSTTDASCADSSFTPGQLGFQLFGMGYVSDAIGAQTETLYIAGGDADQMSTVNLGRVDPASLAVTKVGTLSGNQQGPELTGTGTAELFGYFPGSDSVVVAQIDKTTGKNVQSWNLPGLGDDVAAWAFAHWGGRFYIFVSTQDDNGDLLNSQVQLFDPATGKATIVIPDSNYEVVGAGVSTCAPVTIG